MQHHLVDLVIPRTKKKTYHKVSFSFEKFRTEQTVDSICQLQRLETNKTLCFIWASFWKEVHRSRWNVKFKMVNESHANKIFQELLNMPSSLLATSKTTRKPPRERLISNDQRTVFAKEMQLRVKPIWTKQLLLMVFSSKNVIIMHFFITWYLIKRRNSPKF